MLQNEIGSIMKFCYDKNSVKIYADRIPQDMVIPCMYFPPPIVLSSSDTITTYRNSYQMFIKVFDKKTQLAHHQAHLIAEEFRRVRGIIPVVSLDGTPADEWMRVNLDIQTKVLDENVVQLTLKWDSRYSYDRDEYPVMETFISNVLFKND